MWVVCGTCTQDNFRRAGTAKSHARIALQRCSFEERHMFFILLKNKHQSTAPPVQNCACSEVLRNLV